MDDESAALATGTGWQHATVSFPGGNGVPLDAAASLSTALARQRFHFVRKRGGLRLRTEYPVAHVLDELVAAGLASGWVGGIYEPETHVFGGREAMEVAHDLFCADSRAALTQAGRPESRERCVLLVATMLRAAQLDRFEAGDVWAKVAAMRPSAEPPTGIRRARALTSTRRLIHTDATRLESPYTAWAERLTAFEDTGRRLHTLADNGRLTRGLRAVLAHHVVFTLNRAGLSAGTQAALAWLATQSCFADTEPSVVSTVRSPNPSLRNEPMETTAAPVADPTELRAALVHRLTQSGTLRTDAIVEAFRSVERHLFVPDVEVADAYADDTVSVKTNDHGEMISAISQPTIVATQLEQLDARPGQTILEAGAATGYNAALVGQLVQPSGRVWTIDVDQDLVDGARAHLAAAGVSNVTVVLGDGATGLPEHAPFDRIIFTVGAGDIPAAILNQLAPDGRLVIPLRIRGSVSRSIAFERDGDTWTSVSSEMATFMPLRNGICDDERTIIRLAGAGDVRLEIYAEQDVDVKKIATVLDHPPYGVYTGVKFRKGSAWEWLYLWLACTLRNGISRMSGTRPGFTPHFFWGSMAAVDHDTLAYLTVREGTDADGRFWEIGVIGHGPRAHALADDTAAAIEEWAARTRRDSTSAPRFRMATRGAKETIQASDPRFVIDKANSRIVVDWA